MEGWMTVNDAAELIGVHPTRVRALLYDGKNRLRSKRLGADGASGQTVVSRRDAERYRATRRANRPLVMRPCRHCGKLETSRGLARHEARCAKNPRTKRFERCPHCGGEYSHGVPIQRHVTACAREHAGGDGGGRRAESAA